MTYHNPISHYNSLFKVTNQLGYFITQAIFHHQGSQVVYPLVNVYKTMENHHAINGQINSFYGHFP